MKVKLYEETIMLLKKTDIPLEEIGSSIGMSGRWVRKVRDGVIKDPGVQKTQKLFTFLSQKTAA